MARDLQEKIDTEKEKLIERISLLKSELGSSANERARWGSQLRQPTHCNSDYMKIAEVSSFLFFLSFKVFGSEFKSFPGFRFNV